MHWPRELSEASRPNNHSEEEASEFCRLQINGDVAGTRALLCNGLLTLFTRIKNDFFESFEPSAGKNSVLRGPMIQRTLFDLGLATGVCFDVIPTLLEKASGIYLCRESCPGWFRLCAILVYLTMPILWGLVLVFAFRKAARKRGLLLVLFLAGSALLMLAMTWASYRLHLR
ncbi:hypothetical protein [Variovorax sp. PvP013]|uniref:hypothetical protein n=1 Tax=Variovorax sp. PvP013 TaxID=3156435 RepID=UPI003D1B6598